MPDYEDDDIDKMFEEMIFSDGLKEIESHGIDAVININKVSKDTIIKELIFITQSLSQSIDHVNELILNYLSIEDYDTDDNLKEILGSMYKLSEDFDEIMIELLIEESEILNEEDIEGEQEDE